MARGDDVTCPDCGAAVAVDDGYASWCGACEWNVVGSAPKDEPAGVVDKLYARAGRRFGDRVVGDLVTAAELEPRWTASRVLSIMVAVGVFLLTVAFAVAAFLLALQTPSNPFALIVAVILGGLAWLMRPRPLELPDEGVLDRSDAPEFYRLADAVADAAGSGRADVIVLDAEVNAAWGRVGYRRRRMLQIGLPLWSGLSSQARVALLAHEFGHERNGDASRSLLVENACNGLASLYEVLAVGSRDTSSYTGLELVVDGITWTLARPAWLALALEVHLLWNDSQRAEYLADEIAARVGGTAGTVALLEDLLAIQTVEGVVQRHSREHLRPTGALFDEIHEALASVPPRERERRRRAARRDDARLDATHPPQARRIELVETRTRRDPLVVVDDEWLTAIDGELAPHRQALAVALVDAYRSSLLAV